MDEDKPRAIVKDSWLETNDCGICYELSSWVGSHGRAKTFAKKIWLWSYHNSPITQFSKKSMTPRRGNNSLSYSCKKLPPLSVPYLWRTFSADALPFKHHRLASCIALGAKKKQGHCQLCQARHGGPRTPSKKANANLNCWKSICLHQSLIVKSQQNWI